MILVGVLILVILIILASCVKVVPQATALVMERLGAYNGTLHNYAQKRLMIGFTPSEARTGQNSKLSHPESQLN